MQTSVRLISYEESLTMQENKLEEIVDGESRIMPPPANGHMLFIRTLSRQIERVLPGYAACESPYGLGISRRPLTYRIPDLSVFPETVLEQLFFQGPKDPYVWTAPVLIAECLSPSNRKGLLEKLIGDYASIAVPELWVFHPEDRNFDRYLLQDGVMTRVETKKRGMIQPSGINVPSATPGIDLEDLWRAFHGR